MWRLLFLSSLAVAAMASSDEPSEADVLDGDGDMRLDEEEMQVLMADDDEEEEAMVADEEQFDEDKDGDETSENDANVTFQVENRSNYKCISGFYTFDLKL